jgi:hypothetical protein
MYTNRFVYPAQPISESELAQVESALGISLPPELRKHYLFVNGGIPERSLARSGQEEVNVHGFMPILHGKRGERLEDTYLSHKIEDPWIPEHLIPFAFDGAGEYFCFSTAASSRGAVFHLWTEFVEQPDRALLFLAPSLFEFINGLERA